MRGCLLALLIASHGFAQFIVDAAKIPPAWRDIQAQKGDTKLACRVTTIPPRLNFSFRFETGYVVEFPLRQFRGKGHWIATIFRVTPKSGEREPVYLLSRARLPEVPETKAQAEFSGGYAIGEGKYRVDWALVDDQGRICAKDWELEAKLDKGERNVGAGLSAGVVDEISVRRWTHGSKGADNQDGQRITVLLNAAPISPRRLRLSGFDRVLLLSSLASMIERLPLRSVRLVVFNLEQQRELYRSENFEPSDFDRVAQSLNQTELGVVSYDVLKNPRGHIDLMTELVNDALKENRSDAVVFVGPQSRFGDKMQRAALPEHKPDDPPFFSVTFRPFVIGGPRYTDPISSAVKQMGGKTFEVHNPREFADAIGSIVKALGQQP